MTILKKRIRDAGVLAALLSASAFAATNFVRTDLVADTAGIAKWLSSGGHLLALGLDEADTAFLPTVVMLKKAEHIAAHLVMHRRDGDHDAHRGADERLMVRHANAEDE